ncbi:DNA fragmentation factor subunit beta [Rhagoletis pomonella]|uniref:DNA fragmentation factor subunit beta n=1 Tax=Rhagoletis pomonella TaxID=28610 RepID=UPI0017820C16|nr:DNA fragmentation factor subunit beta [Rhagoletis pomonella]XP_036321798.1 DNA fragmentation factor subunit beta [Rhagoletis pomonella]XP_036321799.1 DNA fragmentation factor subunit beta [Rhagoletis pomonella]
MLNYFKDVMAPTTRSSKAEADNKDGGICTKVALSENCSENSLPPPQMKGYKITDNERTKKYGIGANSLQMLKEKAILKFPIKDLKLYLSTDGFEISDDDYFQTLAAQTLFIVAGPDEIITTDADFEFEKLRKNSPLLRVADIIYEFIEHNPEQFRKMITDYENRKICHKQALDRNQQPYDNKTQFSLRTEHSEWFEGQEERCHSKEEAMARRAQDRMRSYYYKTKEELTRNKLYRQNLKARHIIDAVLEQFRYLLIGCDYFSTLFNRKCPKKHSIVQQHHDDETDASAMLPNKRLRQVIKEYTARHQILDEWSVSLCTELGDFYCQGSYSDNGNCCALKHTINPYASRENLILFQVWNLDHQIELSRSILPALIDNVRMLVEQPQKKCTLHNKRVIDISVLEYFLEIFSLKNLKLVHIVCHEKTQRANKSNGRLVCAQCHEYKIVQELMGVRENEEDVDVAS